ncbi:hypothetical protein C2869_14440 [Saccharobesus litoralis]|uniref:Methyltransferase domain-containing protein n=1 Tax=Saccharobesus litoralis TaxID=2172099 RepID=A0A2S0VTM1_9ALTE|nr:methyltransferase domain-containing protein [Saccharobesus litoralis]AWB67564.1 hypothetical protein C2869_14440 [Saccharobesus litoralis]
MSPSLQPEQKVRIANAFSKAAKAYDQIARLQKSVVKHVCKLAKQSLSDNSSQPLRILDLGCGTADLATQLEQEISCFDYVGVDIAPGMLEVAKSKMTTKGYQRDFVLADIENLPELGQFDLIISSLAIQWCDIKLVFSQFEKHLKKNGCFVLSTLLDGTLAELNQTWLKLDETRHINQFLAEDTLRHKLQAISSLTSNVLSCVEELSYPNVLSIMHELKGIGANEVVNSDKQRKLTKAVLRQLEELYPTCNNEKVVSWHIAYIKGQLKNI